MDLLALMRDADFYVPHRRLTRPNAPPPGRAAAKPAPGGAAFGTPGALELPTPGELRAARSGAGLDTLKRLVSPVFFSTAPSGRVSPGLAHLPPSRSGPVLYVGNHQVRQRACGRMFAMTLHARELTWA